MRFFEHQRQARAQSRRLSFWFALIIIGQVILVNLALLVPFALLAWVLNIPWAQIDRLTPHYFFAVNTGVSLFYILGGWWLEASRLADGGQALAKRIGAVPAQRSALQTGIQGGAQRSDPAQIQFTNIVQEMAIAANMRPPVAFVLPRDNSINAFAAGWDDKDSVICVTQGALDQLTRDELMGLVAHEFSHIYEGDTRLNMRLAGMVLGLELLHNLGQAMSEGTDDKIDAPAMLLGGVLLAAGWLGWTAARVLKAAISREREFLADARAVQYTRQKDGLGATLRKVQWQHENEGAPALRSGLQHPAVQHMLLVGDWLDTRELLQTHPPIAERIRRIYGRRMPPLDANTGTAKAQWQNPFAASQPLPLAKKPMTSTGETP